MFILQTVILRVICTTILLARATASISTKTWKIRPYEYPTSRELVLSHIVPPTYKKVKNTAREERARSENRKLYSLLSAFPGSDNEDELARSTLLSDLII